MVSKQSIKNAVQNATTKFNRAIKGKPEKKAEQRFEHLQGAIHNETIQDEEEIVEELWEILGLCYKANQQGQDMQHMVGNIKKLIYNETENPEQTLNVMRNALVEEGANPQSLGF